MYEGKTNTNTKLEEKVISKSVSKMFKLHTFLFFLFLFFLVPQVSGSDLTITSPQDGQIYSYENVPGSFNCAVPLTCSYQLNHNANISFVCNGTTIINLNTTFERSFPNLFEMTCSDTNQTLTYTSTFVYEEAQATSINYGIIFLIILIFSFGLLSFAINTGDWVIGVFSGILFILFGIYLTIYGFPLFSNNLIESGIGIASLLFGLYVFITSTIEGSTFGKQTKSMEQEFFD